MKNRELRLTGLRIGGSEVRLLPTEHAVVMLNGNDFEFLRNEFPDQVSDVSPAAFQRSGEQYRLMTRVVKIGRAKPVVVHGHIRRQKIHLRSLLPLSSQNQAQQTQLGSGAEDEGLFLLGSGVGDLASQCRFLLWDEQINLSSLFKKGDLLAIEYPYVPYASGDDKVVSIEYGSSTVLYVLPSILVSAFSSSSNTLLQAQGNGLSSSPMLSSFPSSQLHQPSPSQSQSPPKDGFGNQDFKYHPERVFIKDLGPRMINVCLFGCIVGMFRNVSISQFFTLIPLLT